MRRTTAAALLATAAACLLAVQAPAVAAPAADTTGPTLTLAPTPALIRGAPVSSFFGYDPTHTTEQYYETHARLMWSASDPSGLCGYDVVGEYGDGDYTIARGIRATHLDVRLNNYDGGMGGYPTVVFGFKVVAHDCAGNTTTKTFTESLQVLQEDGTDQSYLPTGTTRATGAWLLVNCDCALEHHYYRARSGPEGGHPGDTFFWTPTLDAARSVAVIGTTSPKGSAHGAKVYVDGALRTTISTLATRRTDHVVLWQARLAPGEHTVQVVYTGHGELDIDAFATS